ncbi:EAL domain, c-di-GMP-specific phosphodiesterase class I (or its enzymatically inactive variant) [Lachnospiraceae bacterium]|nr:EAL domain, c-di-GMP-specific phosphodiesterase class I (or its enzymatically inactive variant) [Lachnospiraceae bacterium]
MDKEKYFVDNFERALTDTWIQVYYQPIVRTITKRICGAEALAQWIDPYNGVYPPSDFLPILEKHHLVERLDLYICRIILDDLQRAFDMGVTCVPTSINLSYIDFEDSDVVEGIIGMIREYNIPKRLLTIEITDFSTKCQDKQKVEFIRDFRANGCNVWLDDFGRNGASLEGLKKYPYSAIKFDMRFFDDVYGADGEDRARIILSYTLNMAKCMKVGTLIKGVDTEEQYAFFKRLGCEMAQGSYFSDPVPLSEMYHLDMEMESLEEEPYYRAIGQIEIENTLIKSGGFRMVTSEAMAVVEYMDHAYNFLYMNEASRMYLKNLGLTKDSAEKLFNQRSGMLQENLHAFIRQLSHGARGVRLFFLLGDKIVDLKGDFIARNAKTGAIAFALTNPPATDDSRSRAADFHKAMEGVYLMFDRLDLVSLPSGIIENTYLNTYKYGGIHPGMDFREAVMEFADQYIVKRDREKFLEFINIDTFEERIGEDGYKFLTENFHTIMDDGQVINKNYVLSRIHTDDNDMMLIAIIRIDEAGTSKGSTDKKEG